MTPGGPVAVPRVAWVAWATVCVVWGTTFFAIKIALETIPPFLLGGIRYTIAGAILAAALRLAGRPLPPLSASRHFALLGVCMVLAGNGGVVWGEQHVPSGLAAVLIGTTPFWMVGVDAALRDGTQLFARQWTGLTVGLTGIVLLVWPDVVAGGARGRRFGAGVISLQLACAGWSLGSAYTRRRMVSFDVLASVACQMLWGGGFMLLAGLCLGEPARLGFTPRTLTALTYLTFVGSIVGFGAFSFALKHLDIAVVGLYTYINPIIAVTLGTLLLGEPFHLRMLAAAGIIVVGILIVGPLGAGTLVRRPRMSRVPRT
jgi:drug/metabolite transporter (DMT)-like permease